MPKVRSTDAIQSFNSQETNSQETPIVVITDSDSAVGVGYSYTIGEGGPAIVSLLQRTLVPVEMIWLLVLFYLVLGCFLETLSMMVGTIPVVMPIILHLGIDPVWFGIFLVIMMELALITPPVGMNLYVVQGVRGKGQLNDVYKGITPFVITMLLTVALIIMVPDIVTIVPDALYQ